MTSEQTLRRVRMTINVMQALKPLSAQCTLNTAIAFLTVASKPGITVGDVQKTLGLPPTSTARSVAILYKKARGVDGLDLVESRPHPVDMRLKLLHLTPKGMRIWHQIEALLGG